MISIRLRLGILCVSLFILLFIFRLVKKERIPVRYSLIWFFSGFILLLIACIPEAFVFISKKIGFSVMSNLIIGLFIFILLLLTIFLTAIVSKQRKQITLLVQEISLLKKKVNDDEK